MTLERPRFRTGFRLQFHHLEAAFATTGINLLALAMPILLLQVYDRIIPNHSVGTITLLAFGVVTAVVAEALLRIARQSILGRLATRFEAAVGARAASHLLGCELAAFERESAGRHVERLAAVSQLRDDGSGQNLLTWYDLPFAAIYLGLIAFLGGPVAAVAGVALALLALAAYPAGRAARRALNAASETDDVRYNFLVSALLGLSAIKFMGLERALLRRHEILQERRLLQQRDAALASQRLTETSQLISQLATIGTVAVGSLLVLEGRISVGGLTACTLLVGRFLQVSQNLILASARHQNTVIARERLTELFDLPPGPAANGTADATAARPLLAMRGIRFAYGETVVLDDAEFSVRPGEVVALVGANGSGKSTLLSLIAGLHRPQAGGIDLGELPLDAYSRESLADAIAYVPQQETLFQGTLLENITMFRPELVAGAREAADLAGLTEHLLALPLGFATPINEVGGLPRGVAQRVALARALVRKPRLLLLDDANSATDDHGDERFAILLDRLRETCGVVIVSHRPRILKLADRVCRLDAGRIDTLEGLAL